jgi:hypothetical protein
MNFGIAAMAGIARRAADVRFTGLRPATVTRDDGVMLALEPRYSSASSKIAMPN